MEKGAAKGLAQWRDSLRVMRSSYARGAAAISQFQTISATEGALLSMFDDYEPHALQRSGRGGQSQVLEH